MVWGETKFRENLCKKNKLSPQRLAAFTNTARDPVVLTGVVELYVTKHMTINRKASQKHGEVKCLAQERNVPDRSIRRQKH